MDGGVGDRSCGRRRRDGEAAAHVAHLNPATGVLTVRTGACHPAASTPIVAVPMVDRACRMPTRSATRPTAVSPSVRQPGGASRRGRRRQGRRPAGQHGGGVDDGEVAQRAGAELDEPETLPRAPQADLRAGAAVGVVEDDLRCRRRANSRRSPMSAARASRPSTASPARPRGEPAPSARISGAVGAPPRGPLPTSIRLPAGRRPGRTGSAPPVPGCGREVPSRRPSRSPAHLRPGVQSMPQP